MPSKNEKSAKSNDAAENKIRDLYIKSGLSYKKLSELTGIKYSTICAWIIGRRNPPSYVVELIEQKLAEAAPHRTNSEIIRSMSDEQLTDLLTSIQQDALKAKGDVKKVSPEFANMKKFVKSAPPEAKRSPRRKDREKD